MQMTESDLSSWALSKRMQNYYIRNKKMSPMHQLNFTFLKRLYMYLTKQELSKDFKKDIYDNYIQLVNSTYFPNRSDTNKNMHTVIYRMQRCIIDNEYKGPLTFILLNSEQHYLKLIQAVNLIYVWSTNPEYYGYANEKEFWETMEFLRKQFSENEVDMYAAVGKWPRKFRQRFKRR